MAWYDIKKSERESITEQYRDFFGQSDPDDEDVVTWWASHQGADWRKEVVQKYIADLDTTQMSDYEKVALLENQLGIPSGEYLSMNAQERLSYWRGAKALPGAPAEAKAQPPSKPGRARKAVRAKARRVAADKFSWQAVYNYLGQDVFGLISYFNTEKPMSSELMSSLRDLFGEASLGYTEFDDWLGFVKMLWRASTVKSFRGKEIGVAKRIKPPAGKTRAGRRFTPWG